MALAPWRGDMLKWITLFCCMVSICSATNEDPRYIGCYAADLLEKLHNATQPAGGNMTVDKCARKCANERCTFAGLKNGNQCVCTNRTVYGLSTCERCYQNPCEENSSLTCDAFEIFEAVVDRRYLGCYQDSKDSRIFEQKQIIDDRTTDNCVQRCAAKNFPLSGTQYKRECFCGHGGYKQYGKCITDSNCTCNTRCLGNQTELCGGALAMSVYRTECREVGRWGSSCSNNCHCKDGKICDITTGSCPNDECAPGWHGSACNQTCGRGKYGANCRETCDQCSEQTCDRFNGHCNISCAAGMKNFPLCDQECDDNKFGMNCAKVCHCKKGEICNKSNGHCPSGVCSPGYDAISDPSCQEECKTGKFGLNCQNQCRCKNSDGCDKVTGACEDNLCAPGFDGPHEDPACQKECGSGKYGANCRETCDRCSEQACDRFNGQCSRSCVAGRKNIPRCDQECDDNKFGMNCAKDCHCKKGEICDKRNGSCPGGVCSPGYDVTLDPSCQEACSKGKYGANCRETCDQCSEQACNRFNGQCSRSCVAGRKNFPHCDQECQLGTYGISCEQTCDCPNHKDCNKITGECRKGTPKVGLIAAGIFGALALLLLLGLAVYFRRQIGMLFKKKSPVSIHSFSQDIPLYENANQSGSPMVIRLERLESVVLAQKKNQLPFHEEYETLPKGTIEDQVGNLPGNKQKNRFKNIIPYDSARVKLSIMNDNPFTDYVNASFINGFSKKKHFIACQAPTPKTLVDFWRMMWEQNIEVVVMLTQLVEGAKVKCTKYWSDEGQHVGVGDLTVETLKQEILQHYTVRKMQVRKDNEVRYLTQMHFTAWKDYSVPDNGNTMLHFHLKVMENVHSADNGPPIVVHCSAGVGRTGTFIALDYLLEQAEKEGSIDIFDCVEKMRAARTSMVNTRAQYEYLHDTMLEWYTVGMTAVETSDFQSLFNDLEKIKKQYRLLENVRNNSNKDMNDGARGAELNRAKNRNTKIIPNLCSQVKLMTDIETLGDYINAVFVDGYQKRNAFIATQLPLPHTRGDLWRMVWDYKLSIIVCFCSGPKDFYWPKIGSKFEVGSFLLETKSDLEVSDEIIAYDITMMFEEKLHTVKILTLCNFKKNEKKIPDLLEMNNTVQKWQQSLGCSTILVQCLYGVEMCGIFIAVSNLLKMINTEREVDVFQCVKKMRGQRPEFIQHLQEYQFLFQVIHQYLHRPEDSSLYMNV